MRHLDVPDCPDRFPTVFEVLFFIEDCVKALPGYADPDIPFGR